MPVKTQLASSVRRSLANVPTTHTTRNRDIGQSMARWDYEFLPMWLKNGVPDTCGKEFLHIATNWSKMMISPSSVAIRLNIVAS